MTVPRPRALRTAALGAVSTLAVLALAACDGGSPTPSSVTTSEADVTPTTTRTPAPNATPTATTSPAATPTPPVTKPPATKPPSTAPSTRPLAGMSLDQKVGQLFMVGATATGPEPATGTAISRYHVGNVILVGRSQLGVTRTRAIADALQRRATSSATHGLPLFVGVDQEGGNIQVLRGPGFATMPTALTQGKSSPSALRRDAATWGAELARAGVNLNLSPVMDTVPSPADNASNAPVGYWHRQFGYTPATVSSHGVAFLRGMHDADVATTIKHFPGLGRVQGNTDFTSGVKDTVTTADDPYLAPFEAGIAAGTEAVMTSTAIYTRIDPHDPGAFSRTVVTGLLRGKLGFDGVVITDDVSSAKQVAAWSPGQRAVKAIAAGNDIVLAGRPEQIPAMTAAVIARAKADPAFAQQVDASATRVVTAKSHLAG
ncbi:glycoside hydrolase family 3 N-terminal domain-containing protein [Luteimicrobium sp. DT211]|uniref:glycoside hydrolase family 3 N-terminal domain-containing protein n=1 Tax=Luteimicrobium sp. DT211 TaxID=3393412 RepID=UPI003CF38352